jgi:transcriptional regulator with XRE-family HTH domain
LLIQGGESLKLTLNAIRINAKVSASELAKYVGVSVDTIYSWEKGKTFPRAEKMQRILNFYSEKGYNVNFNDIIFLV